MSNYSQQYTKKKMMKKNNETYEASQFEKTILKAILKY